jgi:hypothetical protein
VTPQRFDEKKFKLAETVGDSPALSLYVEDIGLVTDEPQFRNSVWQPLV